MVVAPYKAFSREKLPARIGAHIGLMHVNITLCALPIGNWTSPDIDFNERFHWNGADEMGNSYRQALRRGLPYPILTVAEYFSLGQEGFAWGGRYRAAGYYASIVLWASFAGWLLMNLLLVSVPRYGAYMMAVTGALLIITAVGYYLLLPEHHLIIIMEGGRLEFHLGWCFWLVLVAGLLCLSIGVIISAIDVVWPHTFSTILEVYYDTPYDRHVILEESHDVRYRKRGNSRGLEDPPVGLGSRILRRLSSKTNNPAQQQGGVAVVERRGGIDNKGYQSDAPKSPWRYPFRRAHLLNNDRQGIQRTLSQDSTTSSIASGINMAGHHSPAMVQQTQPSMHKIALSRMLP